MNYRQSNISGFTLVELAIVLMIIGLLIGGILKGQELINNAHLNSAMRQITSTRAAVLTFQDSYGALPGDMANPGTRLPNCDATPVGDPCNTSGNSNGLIEESGNFWRHMAKGNLIAGVDTTLLYPEPKAATGNSKIYAITCSYLQSFMSNTQIPGSNCLYFENASYNKADGGGSLSSHQAAQMDRKMDDGKPWYGDFRAEDDAMGANCVLGSDTYNETLSNPNACFIGTAL